MYQKFLFYLLITLYLFSLSQQSKRLKAASLLQLRQSNNEVSSNFSIRADPHNPTDTATIRVNGPGGSGYATGTVSALGGGVATSRSSVTTSNGVDSSTGRQSSPTDTATTSTSALNTIPTSTSAPAQPEIVTNTETPSYWTKLGILAKDAALTKNYIYYINLDNKLYQYRITDKSSKQVLDNTDIEKIVSYNDSVFMLTKESSLVFLINNSQYSLNTCAKDISVSNQGEIYKLGCLSTDTGYGIYKFNCKSGDNSYTKNFNKILIDTQVKCEWLYQKINAFKIAVFEDIIYAMDVDNQIITYSANEIKNELGINAMNLMVTRYGTLFAIDFKNILYIIRDYKPVRTIENIKVVMDGILNVPMYIDTDNNLYIPKSILGT